MGRGWRSATLAAGLLVLVVACFAWLLTSLAGAALMMTLLEWQSRPADPNVVKEKAQAIVVLTGQPSRVHEAARLHLATGVPLALVGRGGGERGFAAESEEMEDTVLRRYGIGPRWVENQSLNTRENAAFAWCLMSSMGVRRIALVTHQMHMPRARRRFEEQGFTVIAVPVPDAPVYVKAPLTGASFLPSRAGLQAARGPLREWAGFLLGPLERLIDPARACPYTGTAP
jgi:uncharacterized SAM-binding protein YcdF (DUF218 family)